MEGLQALVDLVRGARSLVVLTGAGISTASGIPDFRSPGTGIWERVDPEEVASIDSFRRDPERFWSFYSDRLGAVAAADPNPAHQALARLERGGLLHGLITQNIDRLHRRAGNVRVAEVHGSIDRAECRVCDADYEFTRVERHLAAETVPSCDCGAPLKPGVVLFGENLPTDQFLLAESWAAAADVMLVVGSSLEVWPVAGLPDMTLRAGGRLAVLNRTPTPYDEVAAVAERRPVERVLPALADALLGTAGA